MDAESEYDINSNKDVEQMMTLQSMIDVSAERLKGLRTQCLTSAELTQQEIRTLEGKLVKHFSCQLVLKARCPELRRCDVPRLAQWLRVVGLSEDSIDAICSRVGTLEALRERSDHEFRALLPHAREEEVRRLIRAMQRLRSYTEALARGEGGAELQLYWDSWERQRASPRARARTRTEHRTSESEHSTPDARIRGVGACVTEPIRKLAQRGGAAASPAAIAKSRSHESQLAARREHDDLSDNSQPSTGVTSTGASPPRSPEPAPPRTSADRLHQNNVAAKATVAPRSPRTPTVSRGMAHDIKHRFTKHFNMIATCDYCEKQILFGSGLKCKECKFKCHRDCENKVPPSCGLPHGYVQAFREKVDGGYYGPGSPLAPRPGGTFGNALSSTLGKPRRRQHPPASTTPLHPGGPDSSSNTSSCNSSCPSSPAPPPLPLTPHHPPHHPRHKHQQFHFPEVKTPVQSPNHSHAVAQSPSRVGDESKQDTGTNVAGDGSRCVSLSGSGSTDSGGAVRADSLDDAGNHNDTGWPRQNSLSMKEWDIPYDELKLVEQIGTGRFGTVWRGSWHGAVAVKLLHVQAIGDDAAPLDTFKHEVATFRKTRHENLVLFMGACMKPPKLAIVTSLCKGMTLHQHLQLRKDKFNPNKTVLVAQQIAQGMGYLHARGIIHKDLKTKNIFLENGKVVITDFGLFSVTKLCFGNNARGDSVGIPQGWLCYLAPELVRSLRADASVHLAFSKATDVYAFGTVFYELLCCEWPFKGQPSEAVIWQVGKGVKQSLAGLQCTKDIKDMIMLCWAYHSTDRPDFAHLLSTLEKFPRKRLARSPSHPVHLSRSADSVL